MLYTHTIPFFGIHADMYFELGDIDNELTSSENVKKFTIGILKPAFNARTYFIPHLLRILY
jgi:hypothetical protein